MNGMVTDASITLSWLLPDEASALAIAVRDELPKAEAVWAPAHWRLEVCNSLWMAERRNALMPPASPRPQRSLSRFRSPSTLKQTTGLEEKPSPLPASTASASFKGASRVQAFLIERGGTGQQPVLTCCLRVCDRRRGPTATAYVIN
jgi:hypothetical protein